MLPRGAVLGGVAVVVVAFYCKLWDVQLLRDEATLLQQLQQSHRPATEPMLLLLGRGFFFIAAAAWVVLGLQSVVTAIQRARYKPRARLPLQPLTDEQARQQQEQQSQEQQGASAAAAAPASAPRTAPVRASQQQEADWREERRRQALEARQRELDQQTAVLKEQQAALKEQQAARRAQAAEAAARKKAEQAAAEARARAETEAARAAFVAEAARRREAAARATQDQWLGMTPPRPIDDTADLRRSSNSSSGGQHASSSSSQQATNISPPAGSTAPSPQQPSVAASSGINQPVGDSYADSTAAAAPAGGLAAGSGEVSLDEDLYGDGTTAGAALDRQLRQQQDREYQQSLERDRAKAAARAAERKAAAAALKQQGEQQRLSALRASLLAGLAPEPPSGADDVLTIRVRLPGGSQAVRRFSPTQGFEDVFAWVYSLSDMPLWGPGSWALVSAFPRRQLAPPGGSSWAPGAGLQQQLEAEEADGEQLLLPGEWMVQVNQLTEGPLFVRVHDETTLQEVQADIAAQIGVNPSQQRLIFSGQILQQPYRTLKQLKISPGHTLQLAVRAASAGSSNSSSGGGTDPFLAAAATAERARELAKAAEHAFLGSGDVLEVSTVEQLQAEVAHGAGQLALYVEALQTTA